MTLLNAFANTHSAANPRLLGAREEVSWLVELKLCIVARKVPNPACSHLIFQHPSQETREADQESIQELMILIMWSLMNYIPVSTGLTQVTHMFASFTRTEKTIAEKSWQELKCCVSMVSRADGPELKALRHRDFSRSLWQPEASRPKNSEKFREKKSLKRHNANITYSIVCNNFYSKRVKGSSCWSVQMSR